MRVPVKAPVPSPKARRYAPGEPKVNFTKIPNAYDVLIRDGKLSGSTQRDVIWILARETWGSEKRTEYASLSLAQIAELCGGLERGTLSGELKDLAERGIISRESGNACGSETYRYKLTPDNWKKAPSTAKKSEANPKNTTADGSPGEMLVVRPGSNSRCVRARLAPAGREPIDFQIAYANMGTSAVEVTSFIEADTVRITFGDYKANLHQADAEIRKTVFSTENTKTASFVTNKELTENKPGQPVRLAFASVIKSILESYFERPFDPSDPADKKFAAKILKAAGPDLTPNFFNHFAQAELRSMKRRNRAIYPGILIPLAEQAAKTEQLRNLREAEMPRPAAPPPPAEPLDPSKPWDRAREYMSAMMGEIPYTNWLAHTRQISAGSKSIIVAVPDQQTLDYIEGELLDVIKAACAYVQVPEKIIWRIEE